MVLIQYDYAQKDIYNVDVIIRRNNGLWQVGKIVKYNDTHYAIVFSNRNDPDKKYVKNMRVETMHLIKAEKIQQIKDFINKSDDPVAIHNFVESKLLLN